MAECRPLYSEPPLAAVERALPMACNNFCRKCSLGLGLSGTACMSADGEAGGVLIVGEGLSRADAASRRPFVGRVGGIVRSAVLKHWTGPAAYDLAVRCAGKVEEVNIEACRGYLTQTIAEVQPTRIVAVGQDAADSLLGRAILPLANRRAHGWLWNDGVPIPVFVVPSPAVGASNRFISKWVEEDLEWALTATLPLPLWMFAELRIVATAADAAEACADLLASEWFSWDTETAGIIYDGCFLLLALAAAPSGANHVWVWDRQALDNTETSAGLFALLADKRVGKVAQNAKYDHEVMLWKYGVKVQGLHGDTRLWRKLLDAEASANLDVMADLVGMGGHKGEAQLYLDRAKRRIVKIRENRDSRQMDAFGEDDTVDPAISTAIAMGADPMGVAYGLIPKSVLLRYVARDALTTSHLGAQLEKELVKEPSLHRVWRQVVLPASNAVAQVEAWGVPASRDRMHAFHDYLTTRLVEVKKRLDHYGKDVNWGSPVQLRAILYDQLGMEATRFTDTGAASTDEEALQALKLRHPICADILEYRGYEKMDSGYAIGLIAHIRDDGRIHGSINLDGARSGRTSMSDPNLQNIRRADDEDSKMAKDCFVAPPGFVFLQADYSQLELRVAAMLSLDPEMIAIFKEGVDYHQRTAELISKIVWAIPPEQVTKVHRTAAKAFNFGILFGMSDESIAARAGCSVEEARKIRAAIFGKMRRLEKWIQERLQETTTTGFAWTYWEGERGRRRPLYRIADANSNDDYLRELASKSKHSAWNTPIQGTASEFCVASLARCVALIQDEGLPAELVLPVHDSLLFLVREGDVMEVAHEVSYVMCDYKTGPVPLGVDLETGPAWGSMKKMKL